MGDTKRWTVTYTKHMKQKRKVYQDGVLELHGSCDKVLLYDDGRKILGSRFWKKDEVIESGGTLAFDAYLVDIGELEGNYKPLKDLNIQRRDKKPIEKMGAQRQKASHSSEDRKVELKNSGASQNYPNVTKKFIKGNKQIELQKSIKPQDQSNATQTSSRKWSVLYTTQVTQKAKKYHDGILRQLFCGSHQRQVILYDDCGQLLVSRFLKKDELVESGATIAFDTHLVDIGDSEEKYENSIDLNAPGDKHSNEKTGIMGKKVGNNYFVRNNKVELKKNEGPPNSARGNNKVELKKNDGPPNSARGNNKVELKKNEGPPNSARGSHQNDASGHALHLYSSGTIDTLASSIWIPRKELQRDACQILSILKNPEAQKRLESVNLQIEQTYLEQSLLQSHPQFKGESASGMVTSNIDAGDKYDRGFQKYVTEDYTHICPSGSTSSQAKVSQRITSSGATNQIDAAIKDKSQPDYSSALSNAFPGAAASTNSKPLLVTEYSQKGVIDLMTATEGSHDLEINTCDSPQNNDINCTQSEKRGRTISFCDTSKAPTNCLSENVQAEKSLGQICCEGGHDHDDAPLKQSNNADNRSIANESSHIAIWILEDEKEEKLTKVQSSEVFMDNVNPDAQRCEEAFLLSSSSGSVHPSACVRANAKKDNSKELKSVASEEKNVVDIPSFDLGI